MYAQGSVSPCPHNLLAHKPRAAPVLLYHPRVPSTRLPDARVAQARPFAKELLDLRSDVILANSTPVAAAVRDITRTTPTVFVQVSDPMTAGLVHDRCRSPVHVT